MKQFLVLVALVGVIFSSCNKPNINVSIKSENDSISYLIGLAYGKQLKSIGLTEYNINALAKGINEAFTKDSLKITEQELNSKLSAYVSVLQQRISEKS